MPAVIDDIRNRPLRHFLNAGPGFTDIFKGPDDQDFLYKAGRLFRVTGPSTFMLTAFDCILFSEPSTIIGAAARGWYWGLPLIGGGLAYNCTVTALSSLRGGKSDQTNHFVAGCAAGSVMGAARRSLFFGVVMGGFLGIMGGFFKDSIIWGYRIIPDMDTARVGRGNAFSHQLDWSVLPPFPQRDDVTKANLARGSYWARSEEEAKKLMEENDFDFHDCINLKS